MRLSLRQHQVECGLQGRAGKASPGYRRRLGRIGHTGRLEAQRGIRHLEHLFAHISDHPHIGGHARQQHQRLIVGRHHRGIGDDVLDIERGLANLGHQAGEGSTRKGINGKSGLLTDAKAADLGLVDRYLDLHVAQVLGDQKQLGRCETDCHSLTRLDRALDDDAVDRCTDDRPTEINPCR